MKGKCPDFDFPVNRGVSRKKLRSGCKFREGAGAFNDEGGFNVGAAILGDQDMGARLAVKSLILDSFLQQAAPAGVRRIAFAAVFVAYVLLPTAAWAQGGPGFLFDPPRASIGMRMSYSMPTVGSDLFSFTRERFTLEDRDFRSPQFGGELAVRVTDRVDLVADVAWTRSRSSSEYRDWEDFDGLPIGQETAFERTSLTFGAKYYLGDRGRAVGQFAWIPTKIAPYVGGGVGVMRHDLTQNGDFVDFDTFDVFSDRLGTSGTSAIADARIGADFPVGRRVFLTGEARYHFGSGPTGGDYIGFADTDLSGLTLAFGISFRLPFSGR